MDLSKLSDKELTDRANILRRNQDWAFFEELCNRRLSVKIDALKALNDLYRIGQVQGEIRSIEWVLRNDNK